MASWKGNYTPEQIKSLKTELVKRNRTLEKMKIDMLVVAARESKSHKELALKIVQSSHELASQLNDIVKICEAQLK